MEENRVHHGNMNEVDHRNDIIYFYGGINPRNIQRLTNLLDSTGSHTVKLFSGGGDATAGLAGYNAIREVSRYRKITVINEGRCYSAATMLLAGGDIRIARPMSTYLIHDMKKSTQTASPSEYKDVVYNMEMLIEMYCEILHTHLLSKEKILSIMQDEKYMNATECLNYGIVHSIS